MPRSRNCNTLVVAPFLPLIPRQNAPPNPLFFVSTPGAPGGEIPPRNRVHFRNRTKGR
jgi:hypothetical protein